MRAGARRFDAVIFDLDGTLLVDDNLTAVVETCAELATAHPDIDAESLAKANAAAWRDYWPLVGDDWMLGKFPDSSVLSREAWTRALAHVGASDPTIVEDAVARFARSVSRNLRLMHGAREAIDAAVATGAKLAVITNGAVDTQTGKLHDLGILDRFDVVTTSAGAGVMKPDPRIFELALEALGARADRAVHIGDNLHADVGGANAAGLSAIWLNENAAAREVSDPAPDHEVRSLGEIPPLLIEPAER